MNERWKAYVTQVSKDWYRLDVVSTFGKTVSFFGSRHAEVISRARNWVAEQEAS